MVKRQVRWNMETDTGEQVRLRHKYTFLVVNENKEINRITERIFQQLAPVDEYDHIGVYHIKKSNGLLCDVFSFLTDKGRIEHPELIYNNLINFVHDRDLKSRPEEDILPYLERTLGAGIS